VEGLWVSLGFLIGLNAGTVFLREAATAGPNVLIIFGRENHIKLQPALTEKRDAREASIRWQHRAFIKGI
jgi:mevalonate pyrophosphate decarboxylase